MKLSDLSEYKTLHCKPFKSQTLNIFYDQICEEPKSPEDTLSILHKLYLTLRSTALSHPFFLENFENIPGSHIKDNLVRWSCPYGLLNLDALLFTGNEYTGSHTHSEYIIDEVISGSLYERKYSRTGSKYYHCGSEIRKTDDPPRLCYDIKGLPHNVIGHQGSCSSLCLSFGHQEVHPIAEHSIENGFSNG